MKWWLRAGGYVGFSCAVLVLLTQHQTRAFEILANATGWRFSAETDLVSVLALWMLFAVACTTVCIVAAGCLWFLLRNRPDEA